MCLLKMTKNILYLNSFRGQFKWSGIIRGMKIGIGFIRRTRPDTRPSVADGWAGAEMRVFPLFNSSVTDQPTDRPTNQPTDGRTKPLIELRVRN